MALPPLQLAAEVAVVEEEAVVEVAVVVGELHPPVEEGEQTAAGEEPTTAVAVAAAEVEEAVVPLHQSQLVHRTSHPAQRSSMC